MSESELSFAQLALPETILRAVTELGYESPSPIQAEAIPPLLEGKDLLGQAQTGTGKTAAFALPSLARINPKNTTTQLLILAPTRELAIQVAEACQSYAKHISGFNVLPIYGGQSYTNQLRQLKRGAQVVVGTPGRVMDHMRKGTLKLDTLQTLVLDEADEMLRMGFIDDVNWILEHTPDNRQIALFSATMPNEIKRVADQHLNNPVHIKIASKTSTASTINQRYWVCAGIQKLDALTRILEVEEFDGIIIFVRTKVATEELASKLNARGFSAAALNGDIAQAAREKTVDRLKKGSIDILIATDVAARGLDVERISHVINYDVPYDAEAYVHRIGRTGRAGRSGEAILFIAPREKRMLRAIEKVSGREIARMDIPSASAINELRMDQFKQTILDVMENEDISFYQNIIEELVESKKLDPIPVAAALAHLKQGKQSLLLDTRSDSKVNSGDMGSREPRDRDGAREPRRKELKTGPIRPLRDHPDVALTRYKINVGRKDQVAPGQIVAAIANAVDLSSEYIGQIEIYESMTTVDLPEGMPKEVLRTLEKTRVSNRPMNIQELKGSQADNSNDDRPKRRGSPSKGKKMRKGSARKRD
jgi:ATP-dependent RNA helicase DeaD